MNETDFLKLQARCVSHEIRNSVSVCEMYSEIAKKHLLRDGYKNEAVFNAVDCIQNSLKIIGNSLLDLKTMNSLTPRIFDLKELLLSCLNVSRAYLVNKNIEFQLDIDITANVLADEYKFSACVMNLIKNASEAIQEKGRISVKALVDSDVVKIQIENTGTKIPADKQQTIFDAGVTTKIYGNGLGLFICKNNLNLFDADLNLLKSDDESTIFEITLQKAEIR